MTRVPPIARQEVRLRFRWLVAGALLLARSLSGAPPVVPSDVQANLRQRVDYGYAPGVIVGVRNLEGTTYFAYGQTDRKEGRPVDERTLFEIGSITKVFTTTVLADMAERGELRLTNQVQDYVPAGVKVPTRQGRAITLTHLATHTSGLPYMPDNLASTDGNNPFAGYSVEAMFEFLNTYTLTRNPGALYEYSNYGVGLLGYLLADLAQTDYESLVRQRITDPLGLDDTRIQLSVEQRSRLAHGYSGVLPIPEFEMAALEGAGALRSSASDLLTFLAANRGWLESPLYPAMTNAQRSRVSTPTPGLSVGLGWHLLTLSSGAAVWHNGATIGHRAFAGFVRDGPMLAVALANSDYDTTDLGLHLLDPASPLGTLRRPADVALDTLRHYVGRYQRADTDWFTISLREGRLILGYSADLGRSLTLYPITANRFYLTFPEAEGRFTTNSAGQATTLVWSQAGQTTSYPKVRVPTRLGIQRSAAGLELELIGDTDRDYVVEASTDFAEWRVVSTNTIWDNPMRDPRGTQSDRQFYRVRER